MFTDGLRLGITLPAIYAASRANTNPQRTSGTHRLEVLAAPANAVLFCGVAIFVAIEAVRRFGQPPKMLAGPMVIVAVAGLLANLVAFLLLRSGTNESLNVRGAYLEVLGNLLGSVGVIAAAAVVAVTDWWFADPTIAVAASLLILLAHLPTGPCRPPGPGAGRAKELRRARGGQALLGEWGTRRRWTMRSADRDFSVTFRSAKSGAGAAPCSAEAPAPVEGVMVCQLPARGRVAPPSASVQINPIKYVGAAAVAVVLKSGS